jgi:hypothetical protein
MSNFGRAASASVRWYCMHLLHRPQIGFVSTLVRWNVDKRHARGHSCAVRMGSLSLPATTPAVASGQLHLGPRFLIPGQPWQSVTHDARQQFLEQSVRPRNHLLFYRELRPGAFSLGFRTFVREACCADRKVSCIWPAQNVPSHVLYWVTFVYSLAPKSVH